jgi:L-glyceraldehyde 3-phosphate reductase
MAYQPDEQRYQRMEYRRSGRSGVLLPRIALGLWHNFGGGRPSREARHMIFTAFDLGITHFDLANNYGPPYGSAEENFGRILLADFAGYRDQMFISTKAGYDMWSGPYGNWGSRKYLLASLDQSLERMGLDYVDVFYSHRFDPGTPLEETMGALAHAVHQGKALYAGISSYSARKTGEAADILEKMDVPLLIHQPSYSMLNRWVERGLLDVLGKRGIGCIAFSPLAQGLLTDKYLEGVPQDSRAADGASYFKREFLSEGNLEKVRNLNAIARRRGQSLAQMALAWVTRDPRVTTVLVGASRPEQLRENAAAFENAEFTKEELKEIDRWATDSGVNMWAASSETG